MASVQSVGRGFVALGTVTERVRLAFQARVLPGRAGSPTSRHPTSPNRHLGTSHEPPAPGLLTYLGTYARFGALPTYLEPSTVSVSIGKLTVFGTEVDRPDDRLDGDGVCSVSHMFDLTKGF